MSSRYVEFYKYHMRNFINTVMESIELNERSQFTKLRQLIHNLKPQGEGLVIATPMNPEGGEDLADQYNAMQAQDQTAFRAENNRMFRLGEMHLKQMGKQYIKQQGVFGLPERSFIVIDMSLKEAIALGRSWKQTSVIYFRKTDKGLEFSIVGTLEDIAIESIVREFSIADDDLADYYSKIGPTKWVIPFYNPDAEARAGFGQKEPADQAGSVSL